MIIGYHASHEQFSPSQLLHFVRHAEAVGFGAIMTSDHFAPWSKRQGNSGNNWAWLGAAMATTSLPFGSLAIPGGSRYHPAVLAQIVATLAEMFPDRLRWIAAGSGEALNETVVGRGWPKKEHRNERMLAGCEIIRALMRGETVTVDQPWFAVQEAKLWSLPQTIPAISGAALSPETAGWMGSWADGLVTVYKPKAELSKIISAFREHGGDGKPLALQLQVSWAQTRDEARIHAWDQWRNAAAPPELMADLPNPAAFDAAVASVGLDQIEHFIPLVTCSDDLLDLISDGLSCGFDEIYVHSVSRDQEGFINFMGHDVLPTLSVVDDDRKPT